MMRKSKKLGVKIEKSTAFPDEGSETTKADSEGDSELHKICLILDNLTLDVFTLMEQFMKQKLELEKMMTDGELHLAKSRYIMGHKSVSTLQLPTENNENISATVTIHEITGDETMFGKPYLKLNVDNKTESSLNDNDTEAKIKSAQDPIKWFGVLVPQDLRAAQAKYKNALTLAVDCANTQIRLHQTIVKVRQLKRLKVELKEKNQ